jgi:hypothetical protein
VIREQSFGAVDVTVWLVGEMNLHVLKRKCHSSELALKRNAYIQKL